MPLRERILELRTTVGLLRQFIAPWRNIRPSADDNLPHKIIRTKA